MDIGSVVSWIQVGLWIVAVALFVGRVVRGEIQMPLVKRLLGSNWIIGTVIVLGFLGSATEVYLRLYRPKIVTQLVERPVEKIIEKPVNRIVEKVVPCPKPRTAIPKKTENESPPPMKQDCGGGNCAQSSGQQGGITAGQVNFGPPPSKLTWEVTDGSSIRIPERACTNPCTFVKISLDNPWIEPRFAVMCDAPCKAVATSTLGGVTTVRFLSHKDFPTVAVFVIDQPNPFPSQTDFKLAVASLDSNPVRALDVVKFRINGKIPVDQSVH